MATFYYMLIQYVGDALRREAINVGALVAWPDTNRLSFEVPDRQKTRLEKFDPDFSEQSLVSLRTHVSEWISSYQEEHGSSWLSEWDSFVDDLQHDFTWGAFRFFPPSEIIVGDADLSKGNENYHLNHVKDDLIKTYVHRSATKQEEVANRPTLLKTFKDLLKRFQVADVVERNYTIDAALSFDFGIKNGAHNVIELIEFIDSNDEEDIRKAAAVPYIKMSEAKQYAERSGESVNCYAVVRGKPKRSSGSPRPLSMLERYAKLYDVDNPDEMNGFVHNLKQAARHE